MMIRRCIVVIALLVGGVAPASADPAATARAHFHAGEAHYRAERFKDAIAEYEAAYAALPEPALLFNIAQAYRRDGDATQAIEYYQRFLAAAPESAASRAARQHITELGGVPPEPPPEPAPREGPVPEVRVQHEPAVTGDPPAPRREFGMGPKLTEGIRVAEPVSAVADDSPPRSSPGRGLRLGGLATGGGGVLLAGTAIYFGLRARRLDGEVSDFRGDMWSTELDDKLRAGEAAERNAVIFGVAGGAAIAAGAVLYVVGRRQGRAGPLAVIPTAGGARLVAAGSF